MASKDLLIAQEKEILQYQNKLNKISALVNEKHEILEPYKGYRIDVNAVLLLLKAIKDELVV